MAIISDLLVSGVLKASMYVLMGMGLALLFGVMKVSNFAHGEFYMIGAYFSYIAHDILKLGPLLSIICAPVAAFFFCILVERVTFAPLRKRNRGEWIMNTFLLTAGIQLILQNGIQLIFGGQYRGTPQLFAGSLKIGSIAVSSDRIIGFIISLVTIILFWLFMKKTKTGNAISAVSEDETGAILMGVNISKIHSITFALSCMLAAVAGASLISILPAYPAMGMQPLLKSWSILIIVGLGNIPGTIVGGLIIAFIEVTTVYLMGTVWQDAITFMLIIAVLIFKPNGIFGKALKV